MAPVTRDYSRQSFLGSRSPTIIRDARIGVIGYGGGGSHIGQQLAHIGFYNVVVVDADHVENSNLNRLVGATWSDVERRLPKVDVAHRVARGVNPDSFPRPLQSTWQEVQPELYDCAVIIGCVDSFVEREQLERFCRRFLIPYIDIGMDVYESAGQSGISGQVILSSPGAPCMRCMHFLTEKDLTREIARYGAAGGNPQVVWSNGVLASTAVGLLMQLITPWHGSRASAYLEYNGNVGTLAESHRLKFAPQTCPHFIEGDVGFPFF